MMPTASAVATPARHDVSMPSQLSGRLSSASRPMLSPTSLRNQATMSPGNSAALARIVEPRFIAISPDALTPVRDRNHWNYQELVAGTAIVVQGRGGGFIVRKHRRRYSEGFAFAPEGRIPKGE